MDETEQKRLRNQQQAESREEERRKKKVIGKCSSEHPSPHEGQIRVIRVPTMQRRGRGRTATVVGATGAVTGASDTAVVVTLLLLLELLEEPGVTLGSLGSAEGLRGEGGEPTEVGWVRRPTDAVHAELALAVGSRARVMLLLLRGLLETAAVHPHRHDGRVLERKVAVAMVCEKERGIRLAGRVKPT